MKQEYFNKILQLIPNEGNKYAIQLKNKLRYDFQKDYKTQNSERNQNHSHNVRIMDNKIEFFKNFKEKNILPKSYIVINKNNILKVIEDEKGELWFLKNANKNKGLSIYINTLTNLEKYLTGYQQWILQKKIEPKLYDGRKADTRFRMLLFNTDGSNDFYLHNIGLLRVATNKYVKNSQDRLTQLTNVSVNHKNNNQNNNDDDIVLIKKGLFDGYDNYWEQINKIASKIKESYQDNLKLGYNLFIGIDVIVDNNNKFWLLELNPNPAFVMEGLGYTGCNKIQFEDTLKLYKNRYFGENNKHGWTKL